MSLKASASFQTPSAQRYLTVLCHHFGKRMKVQSSAGQGWVQFPIGLCEMTADDTRLEIRVAATDHPQLDQLMQVVTSHLERFAFRENPMLEWEVPSCERP